MARTILVLNAGSSSIKFALFDAAAGGRLERRAAGAFDDIGSAPHFVPRLMDWIEAQLGDEPLWAAGHRVVFGGEQHRLPERVDASLLARLEALVPMMPLHLPENLSPMRRLLDEYPALPQVACFDTGFHRTLPRLARLFGLPRALSEAGLLRYGFHGLSYEYIVTRLPDLDARAARGRTLVAHLGNGASLCALRAGESVETTMGFSALDGLLMGTRPGALDPGVPLYLLQEKGMDPARLERLLYPSCSPRTIHARKRRSRSSATALSARSAAWPRCWAASTRSSLPGASASTRLRCARRCARRSPGSASCSTGRPMRATGRASARPAAR